MVYLKSWTDFETAVTDLYAKSPRKARYCIKFAPKTGQLVLKLTDDTTCLMYKTHSAIILNRFESLNLRLLSQIANLRPTRRTDIASTSVAGVSSGDGLDDPMTGTRSGVAAPIPGVEDGKGREGTPAPSTPGGPGGGGKRKKKGKR